MPYVDGRHDGRQAIIQVAIIDAARFKEYQQSNTSILPDVRPCRALIDTGATCTMITTHVVSELKLEFVNKKLFRIADNREEWRPAYLFYVAFYGAAVTDGDSEEDGVSRMVKKIYRCTKEINGGEIKDEDSFDILLGMDIISTGNLMMKSDGTFRFEF
jgi:hypothetical protein